MHTKSHTKWLGFTSTHVTHHFDIGLDGLLRADGNVDEI
jgi:hypothetical protein